MTSCLHHRQCLISQRGGMIAWWCHSFHGNQRRIWLWLLQMEIEKKRQLSGDGKRIEEGSEGQGPDLSRKGILTCWPC